MADAHYFAGASDAPSLTDESSNRGEMDELLTLLEQKDSDLRRAAELGTLLVVGLCTAAVALLRWISLSNGDRDTFWTIAQTTKMKVATTNCSPISGEQMITIRLHDLHHLQLQTERSRLCLREACSSSSAESTWGCRLTTVHIIATTKMRVLLLYCCTRQQKRPMMCVASRPPLLAVCPDE